jgi:hypothetical protein
MKSCYLDAPIKSEHDEKERSWMPRSSRSMTRKKKQKNTVIPRLDRGIQVFKEFSTGA